MSTWDSQAKSPNMRILGDMTQVTNVGEDEKWQAIRGSRRFNGGKQWFEIVITRNAQTANTWKFCIGVCPEEFDCNHQKKWVGSQGSWAYVAGTGGICHDGAASVNYGTVLAENDVLRVLLDFDEGTISFAKNGVNYGVAFNNLRGPVYPAVSFTGKGSILQLRVPASFPYPLTSTIEGDDLVDWDMTGWDSLNMSECLALENPKSAVIIKNNGSEDKWQCCRSKTAFSSGRAYFEFHILTDAKTSNTWRFCVGVVPSTFDVRSKQKKWIGSQGSWGFAAVGETCHDAASGVKYGTRYGQDDVIGCLLDFDASTIEFYVNGRAQGVAFRNLRGPVHAGISFTGTNSRVYLRSRKSIIPLAAYSVAAAPSAVLGLGAAAATSSSASAVEPLSWDPSNMSSFLALEARSPSIVRNTGSSDKWQCVTSKQSWSSGRVTFDVEILLPKIATSNTWSFCVGVVPLNFNANGNQKWVGSQGSWGYIAGTGGIVHDGVESLPYHQSFSHGDVISIILDFGAQTIAFAKNGVSPGIAFRGLNCPVKAAVSLTPTNAMVQVRWPPSVVQAAAPVAAAVAVASSAKSAAIVDTNTLIEAEYFGLLFAITDKQKVTTSDITMMDKFKKTRTVTDEMHVRVLGKLGMTSAKFDSLKKFEDDDAKEEETCVICMDEKPNAVFRPCGHLKTCMDCAVTVKDCPMCRQSIKEVVKVFR